MKHGCALCRDQIEKKSEQLPLQRFAIAHAADGGGNLQQRLQVVGVPRRSWKLGKNPIQPLGSLAVLLQAGRGWIQFRGFREEHRFGTGVGSIRLTEEHQNRGSYRQLVTVRELARLDGYAVDPGAVPALQVPHGTSGAVATDNAVLPRERTIACV